MKLILSLRLWSKGSSPSVELDRGTYAALKPLAIGSSLKEQVRERTFRDERKSAKIHHTGHSVWMSLSRGFQHNIVGTIAYAATY